MLNPYILKVQATTYLIDWIGNQIRCDVPFRYLRYNTNANQYNGIRLKVINLLKEILEQKEFLQIQKIFVVFSK